MRITLLATLLCLALSPPLFAEHPTIELTIHPQPIAAPLLKYRLLPDEAEIKAGNAVPILLRMPWEQNHYFNGDAYRDIGEWMTRPLDSAEWQKFPEAFPNVFYDEMKRAAYRRDAHWEYPIGETTAYFILLPDVQGLRRLAGFGMAGKARYHVSRREFDEARECILVGLANGRHIAQTPFYVNQLVAATVCRMMLEQTLDLVAQKESPNLYWALSALPASLVQLDRTALFEADLLSSSFAAATDQDQSPGEAEWKKMLELLMEMLSVQGKTPAIYLNAQRAREELPRLLDVSDERVAAMSDDEATVRWYVRRRAAYDQRVAAIQCLNPREALPRFWQLRAEAEADRLIPREQQIDPLQVYLNVWSLNRRIQALRVIEAVRDYLADRGGKLPATLDEIQSVPIPLDPLTDLSFVWSVEGRTAVLRTPDLPQQLAPREAGLFPDQMVQFEYRLRAP